MNPAANVSSEPRFGEVAVRRAEHAENVLTRLIEQQVAKIPSDLFLAVSLGSMAVSLVFELAGRGRPSRFIGMWAAPLLVMGVYNKLVKALGTR